MIRRVALVAAVLAFLSFFTPVNQQQKNLRAARQHAAFLMPKLHADPRFRQVILGEFTAENGCLYIGGTVANDADFAALKSIISASKPPVKLFYEVWVSSHPDPLGL